MSDQKTDALEHDQSATSPAVEYAGPEPERDLAPQPVARAAATLAAPNAGAPQRARASADLQQSIGNVRVDQMLAANQVSGSSSPVIQRQQKGKGSPQAAPAGQVGRQDVVVIVGRPSQTIPANETPKEKEQMAAWRAAAHALSPVVLEGLSVDQAFSGLKKLKQPIGKLYIIGHADESGIGEVGRGGESVSTTVEDLTARMKKVTGALGANKPETVEMLSCFGGGSPQTMGQIGEALGAKKVRAPVQMTVISGRTINLNGKLLTVAKMQKLQNKDLYKYIKKTDGLEHYDFVAGVPHPDKPLSDEEKLKALAGVLRQTGMISYISFNAEPGERDAVPFWKAAVEKRKRTEDLSTGEQFSNKGLIEVDVQEVEKTP
jgi:hypothetical protein